MGNCVFKGLAGEMEEKMTRVVTWDGGVMEIGAPIVADRITKQFPGHAIYRSRDPHSRPLLHCEDLLAGHVYYLLPPGCDPSTSSAPSTPSTPYRLSFQGNSDVFSTLDSASHSQLNPGGGGGGGGGTGPGRMWKVNLVITPDQLAEILAQDTRVEELIETVRTVAKCSSSSGDAGVEGPTGNG